MTEKTLTKTITTTVYIADDGTEFTSKSSANMHDWRLSATKVYVVYQRGGRSDNPEIYSSKRLAKSAIGESKNHDIREIYLNERLARQLSY